MVIRWLGILLCALCLNAEEEVRLQVLASTDLRGQVMPQDTFTLQYANQGWAKLATLIRGLRAANPDTVLVDCGDATEGEPINNVWRQLRSATPEPDVDIMKYLGYDAMVVGGAEFDHGYKQLRTMEGQAQFPWLAANVVFAADGRRVFTPYVKLEVGGLQVAVVGLSVAAPLRLGSDPTEDLVFQDPVACARSLVPSLREKEKVDLVVIALHSSQGGTPCGDSEQAQAECLADQVPGIDLILVSHARGMARGEHNGVPILQAGVAGRSLGVAEFLFRKVRRNKWELESRHVRTVQPGPDTAPDPGVLDLTAPLRAATETYLNTFATNLGVDLDGRWTRMEDTPLMRLLHTVARQASGAQVSALPAAGSKIFIPKGLTSVRQFYALCPDETRIARIRVTGRQLRAYLEHAARYYTFSHYPDLFNRNMDPGDFDTLDGCTYALDISHPLGQRVVDLKIQGQPVKDDQMLTLGLTTGRLAGSGGYLEAMGWNGQAEYINPTPYRNLLLEYVLSRANLTPPAGDGWHTVPFLDRERVMAEQP